MRLIAVGLEAIKSSLDFFKKDKSFFSISEVISPNILLTDYVKNILDHPGAFQAFEFASGLVQVLAATVLSDGPLSGKKLSEFKNHMPNFFLKKPFLLN